MRTASDTTVVTEIIAATTAITATTIGGEEFPYLGNPHLILLRLDQPLWALTTGQGPFLIVIGHFPVVIFHLLGRHSQ